MKVDKSVLGGQSFELVRSGHKVVASLLGEVLSDLLSETNIGVEASADGSATLCDLMDIDKSLLNTQGAVLELVDVGGELLAEG